MLCALYIYKINVALLINYCGYCSLTIIAILEPSIETWKELSEATIIRRNQHRLAG